MNYLEEFKLNDQLFEFNLEITNEYSDNYSKSCQIENYNSDFVNPTELATLSLKYFLEKFPIPEGSIHTAQEIEMKNVISKNKKIKCSVFLSYSKEIKNSIFLKIKTIYKDGDKVVANSEGTLVVPKN
tara:strand:+ start:50 stop:433 length:384 start_codon:yes stop_codon:yes gene_type:complete